MAGPIAPGAVCSCIARPSFETMDSACSSPAAISQWLPSARARFCRTLCVCRCFIVRCCSVSSACSQNQFGAGVYYSLFHSSPTKPFSTSLSMKTAISWTTDCCQSTNLLTVEITPGCTGRCSQIAGCAGRGCSNTACRTSSYSCIADGSAIRCCV